MISADNARVTVRVIRTDEELMIARSVCRVIEPSMAIEKRHSVHVVSRTSTLNKREKRKQ